MPLSWYLMINLSFSGFFFFLLCALQDTYISFQEWKEEGSISTQSLMSVQREDFEHTGPKQLTDVDWYNHFPTCNISIYTLQNKQWDLSMRRLPKSLKKIG